MGQGGRVGFMVGSCQASMNSGVPERPFHPSQMPVLSLCQWLIQRSGSQPIYYILESPTELLKTTWRVPTCHCHSNIPSCSLKSSISTDTPQFTMNGSTYNFFYFTVLQKQYTFLSVWPSWHGRKSTSYYFKNLGQCVLEMPYSEDCTIFIIQNQHFCKHDVKPKSLGMFAYDFFPLKDFESLEVKGLYCPSYLES